MSTQKTIFRDDFKTLDQWHREGAGKALRADGAKLRLECVGSRQGGIGCHAFCKQDLPDGIAVEYDLTVRESDGLVIAFVAMRGLGGEDAIDGLAAREGHFKDYVGEDARIRSYHVSVSRYNDKGEHTGVSNWRRNPGLHLMAQGQDLCQTVGRKYAIRIEKRGPECAIFVDGKSGPAFRDPDQLPDKMPTSGKIGFRAIGSRVIAEIANFRVLAAR